MAATYRSFIRQVAFNIRTWRRMHGWNQAHLAKVAGVSRGRIAQWETGRAMPLMHRLWDLANALGTTPEKLLQPKPVKPQPDAGETVHI